MIIDNKRMRDRREENRVLSIVRTGTLTNEVLNDSINESLSLIVRSELAAGNALSEQTEERQTECRLKTFKQCCWNSFGALLLGERDSLMDARPNGGYCATSAAKECCCCQQQARTMYG